MQGEGRKCRVRRLIFELGNDFQAAPGDFSLLLQAGPSVHEGNRREGSRVGDYRTLNPAKIAFPLTSFLLGHRRDLCQGVCGQ